MITLAEIDMLSGAIVNDARQAGLIDWDAIEDRTRSLRRFDAWSDPGEFLTSVADSYREDPWADRAHRPEVWIEKDALLGVIPTTRSPSSIPPATALPDTLRRDSSPLFCIWATTIRTGST